MQRSAAATTNPTSKAAAVSSRSSSGEVTSRNPAKRLSP